MIVNLFSEEIFCTCFETVEVLVLVFFLFYCFGLLGFIWQPRKSNPPMLIKMKCSSKRNCHPVYRLTDKILEYQIFILNIKALVGMIHSDRCIEKC